jgi:hypothetical protein
VFDEDPPALHPLLNPRRGVLERGDADPEVFAATMIFPGRK